MSIHDEKPADFVAKSGAVEPHRRVSNCPPTPTASHFLNNLFTKNPAERFNVFSPPASIPTTSVRVLKERTLIVVLTVCLVLGHAGRPARGALHVYGVRDVQKNFRKDSTFSRQPRLSLCSSYGLLGVRS